MRVGIGFDAHRFEDARPLVLGCVELPGEPGLAGHSDADVVAHAVADALLGAAGAGDIGALFPPDDRWRDVAGRTILEHVATTVGTRGWSVANVDVTVVAEAPRLAEHTDAMAEAIAGALSTPRDRISVKATTTDGMGFAGRGEGIAAIAVALVSPGAPASGVDRLRE